MLIQKVISPAVAPVVIPVLGAEIFDPSQLPGLVFWLDAADPDTITESGGLVSQWDDKSVSGKNVTQALGDDKPITGTDTIGGVNVLKFDGNDALINTSFLDLSNTEFTVVVVGEYQSPDGTQIFFEMNNGVSNAILFFYATGSQRFTASNPNESQGIFTEPLDIENILIGTLDATNLKFYANGVLKDTKATGGLVGTFTNQINVGDSIDAFTLDGLLGEIITYDRVLSDAERVLLENHLSDKWGIALN